MAYQTSGKRLKCLYLSQIPSFLSNIRLGKGQTLYLIRPLRQRRKKFDKICTSSWGRRCCCRRLPARDKSSPPPSRDSRRRRFRISRSRRHGQAWGRRYITFLFVTDAKAKISNLFDPILNTLRLIYTTAIIALSQCLLKHRKIFSTFKKDPSLERFMPQCKHHFTKILLLI